MHWTVCLGLRVHSGLRRESESLGVSKGVPPAFAGKSNEKHTQPMIFSWFLNYELLNAIFLMYSLS